MANPDFGNSAVIFGVMNAVYQIAFPSTTDEYLYVRPSIRSFRLR
jgi:hypothetical protein